MVSLTGCLSKYNLWGCTGTNVSVMYVALIVRLVYGITEWLFVKVQFVGMYRYKRIRHVCSTNCKTSVWDH